MQRNIAAHYDDVSSDLFIDSSTRP